VSEQFDEADGNHILPITASGLHVLCFY